MARVGSRPHEPGRVGWAKDVPQSNNGMHPTADTLLVIYFQSAGRRVMRGVGRLRLSGTNNQCKLMLL
jgi:hypothetical protein